MQIKVTHQEKDFVQISVSRDFFEKDAVLAAAYKLTGKASIGIEPESETHVKVFMQPLTTHTDIDLGEVVKEFRNELIDEQLRLDLDKRFGAIRELIMKHAFSPLNDLREKVIKVAGRD
jgi:His-Xaa-Ser system protein HxsD